MTTEKKWPPNIVNRPPIIYSQDSNGGFNPPYFTFGGSNPLIFGGAAPLNHPSSAASALCLKILVHSSEFEAINTVFHTTRLSRLSPYPSLG